MPYKDPEKQKEAQLERVVHVGSDPIVDRVLDRISRRSEAGLRKYGVTMLRDDVSTIEWLRHAQEEALDFAVYIERIIHDLKQRELRSLEENKSD